MCWVRLLAAGARREGRSNVIHTFSKRVVVMSGGRSQSVVLDNITGRLGTAGRKQK